MCSNPIEAISSPFVSDTLTRLWMCIGLVFGIEISTNASLREPAAMADTRAEALSNFSLASPAPLAYSSEVMVTWFGTAVLWNHCSVRKLAQKKGEKIALCSRSGRVSCQHNYTA